MIGVLDPVLFVWGKSPQDALSDAEESLFGRLLREIIRTARTCGITLTTAGEYWTRLTQDFIVPLERRLRTPEARTAVAELRKLAGTSTHYPPAPAGTRVWGFRTMFSAAHLPSGWEDRMADVVARVVVAGQPVVLFARLVRGRNLAVHQGKQHVLIHEVLRWRLYVRPPGAGRHVPVDCVRETNQIRRPWTIRLDPRLPTHSDGARYPYCIPADWHRGGTTVVDTKVAVPAWVDGQNRGWTRPDIAGGAYHWDVFFDDPDLVSAVGTDQLNVVEYGAPAREGPPGSIHHIPKKKASVIKDVGWGCSP